MIRDAFYKDQPSVELAGPKFTASILPGIGAKLASIRSAKREYLFQRPNDRYRMQPFDGVYVEGECSGFDDMFPGIDACLYDKAPWNGARMADHGEVWSLPWKTERDGDSVVCTVHGVRFPYRLGKRFSMDPDGALRIRYRLENLSPFDLSCLWAGHVMAEAPEGTRVEVPEDLRRAVCTIGKSGRIGGYGDAFDWPEILHPDGTTERLDVMRNASVADCSKFYFKDRLKEGFVALRYPDGSRFALRFPADTVPWLGVLMNEKGWDGIYHAILEPCTAPFDRYDAAEARGAGAVLKGNGTLEWHLRVEVED